MAGPDLNKYGRPTRKTSGVTAEMRVAVELLDHGFSVSWPVGDMDAYDLISDSTKNLRRIQIKSISTPNLTGPARISAGAECCFENLTVASATPIKGVQASGQS